MTLHVISNNQYSDLNLYAKFIGTFRNKELGRLFSALRELSQMYLIDSSALPSSSKRTGNGKSPKKNMRGFTSHFPTSSAKTDISTNTKEIANIISDVRRFNGVFEVEELYEFAARRADWLAIKSEVEKELYGDGCEIM